MQKRIEEGAQEILASADGKEITPEQLEELAAAVLAGYQDYAASHNMTDPAKVGEYFLAYLQTESAQNVIASGLAGMVDTSGVTQWLNSQMSGMQQSLQTAITQAMTQAMEQIMQQLMPQVMTQIGHKPGPDAADPDHRRHADRHEPAADPAGGCVPGGPRSLCRRIQVNMTERELSELFDEPDDHPLHHPGRQPGRRWAMPTRRNPAHQRLPH